MLVNRIHYCRKLFKVSILTVLIPSDITSVSQRLPVSRYRSRVERVELEVYAVSAFVSRSRHQRGYVMTRGGGVLYGLGCMDRR